jgi:hypothetical protein
LPIKELSRECIPAKVPEVKNGSSVEIREFAAAAAAGVIIVGAIKL